MLSISRRESTEAERLSRSSMTIVYAYRQIFNYTKPQGQRGGARKLVLPVIKDDKSQAGLIPARESLKETHCGWVFWKQS